MYSNLNQLLNLIRSLSAFSIQWTKIPQKVHFEGFD